MISIEQAREIMEKDGEKYSDKEIQEYIDSANMLAEIFIDGVLDKEKDK